MWRPPSLRNKSQKRRRREGEIVGLREVAALNMWKGHWMIVTVREKKGLRLFQKKSVGGGGGHDL